MVMTNSTARIEASRINDLALLRVIAQQVGAIPLPPPATVPALRARLHQHLDPLDPDLRATYRPRLSNEQLLEWVDAQVDVPTLTQAYNGLRLPGPVPADAPGIKAAIHVLLDPLDPNRTATFRPRMTNAEILALADGANLATLQDLYGGLNLNEPEPATIQAWRDLVDAKLRSEDPNANCAWTGPSGPGQPAPVGNLANRNWLVPTGIVLTACFLLGCMALLLGATVTGRIPTLPTAVAVAPAPVAQPPAPVAQPPVAQPPVVTGNLPANDKHGCPDYGFANQADLKTDNPTSPTLNAGNVGFVWGSHVYVNNVDQGRAAYYLMTPGTYGQLRVQDGAFRWYNLGGATPDQFRAWALCFIVKNAGAHNWGELQPAGAVAPVAQPVVIVPPGGFRSEIDSRGTRFFSVKPHPATFSPQLFGEFEDGSDDVPSGHYKILPGQFGATWWKVTVNGKYYGCVIKWLTPGDWDIDGVGRIRVWSPPGGYTLLMGTYKEIWFPVVQKEGAGTCTYSQE